VIVESPRHDSSILTVEPRAWRASWELVRQRLARLALRDDLAWGMVFKNSGPGAGASLDHVHSQLVALDFVPPLMAAKLAAVGGEEESFARIIREAEHDRRVVATTAELVALVPPAPRQPFEIWLIPRHDGAWFHAVEPSVAGGVADLLREVVARIERVAPGTDFNWWLHQAPFGREGVVLERGSPAAGRTVPTGWRWHLEIMPRISPLAGFELGTGCHIAIMSPEESARRLRTD
jgi:UDPglucose--hexose-1-phosphate uridylyltransferase